MSNTARRVCVCILFSIVFSSCSKTENRGPDSPSTASTETPKSSPSEGPPANVVEASASPVELTSGRSTDALITVKIAPGYHINGNPSSKYQIATAVEISASSGITAGKAIYPPAVSKQFSFSPEPIMVYEKEVVIKQALSAEADAAKGSRTLVAKLRVQPCDDTVCYPPRTLGVSIPVDVK